MVSVTRFTSGSTWNVIPGSVELEGTVRSFAPEVRQTVLDAMERQVNSLEAEGYQVDFQWLPGCPASNNDTALAELIRQTAEKAGFQAVPQKANMGGEDFATNNRSPARCSMWALEAGIRFTIPALRRRKPLWLRPPVCWRRLPQRRCPACEKI